MFLISTRNFPPDVGGIQNLMEGLSNALLNHGPVKVFADSFDDISVIPTFVLTPLIYLGGVFYSINILPEFWRNISMGNPMLYVVNTFREGMLGVSDVSIPFALSMIVFFIILLGSLSLYLLHKGTGIRQ